MIQIISSYVLCGFVHQMQSRRDAEIVRVKKSFLRQYLFDVGATSFRRKISTRLENRLDIMEEGIANDQDRQTLLRHKRLKFNYDPLSLDVHLKIFSKDMTTVQRDKVSTASEIPSHSRSVNLLNKEGAWKEACRNALLGLETSLPSLDEAVSMFGYQANLPQG